MNNYQLAAIAVSRIFNIDLQFQEVELSHPSLEKEICDVAVFINGKKKAYIGWRNYQGCDTKLRITR